MAKQTRKGRKTSNARKTRKGGRKGLHGYMKFASEVRPQILKQHPEMKSDVIKVARKIGEQWRRLSPAEKSRY